MGGIPIDVRFRHAETCAGRAVKHGRSIGHVAGPLADYREHRIAARRVPDGWTAILNDESQPDTAFESLEVATAWFRRRVDNRSAEANFPWLADA